MKANPLLLILIVCCLAACGSAPSGPVPTFTPANNAAPVTIMPTFTPDAECSARLLETWIGRSKENTRGFVDVMNSSLAVSPQQANGVVTQLSAFRGVVGRVTIPNCAKDESALIFAMMDGTITAFGDYAAGRKKDVAGDVVNANAQYSQIVQREKQLEDLLTIKLGGK